MTKHQHDDLEEKLGSLEEFMHERGEKQFETTRVSRHGGRTDVPVGLYRKIALAFLSITGALLIVMLLLTSSNATITITPKKEVITNTLIRTVGGTGTDTISGTVLTEDVPLSKTFSVAQGKEVESFATGKIAVHNDSTENLTFIPKTRFQSTDGIIFRIKTRVDIPAGKTTMVSVTSDTKGKPGETGAGKFTIPGLSLAKQKQVYGVSDTAMTGGIRTAGVLTQDDVTKAQADVLAEIKNTKEKEYSAKPEAATFSDKLITVEVVSTKLDSTVGTEVDHATITGTVRVTALYFDGKALDSATRQAVFTRVPDGMKLEAVGTSTYELEKVDATAKTASLKVTREGTMVLDDTSTLLDPKALTDKSKSELDDYFKESGHIETWDLKLRPRWRSSTPSQADKIVVVLE